MEKIVLTGGTGFLGTCLLKDLAEKGYKCVVFTRRPQSAEHYHHKNIEYIEWIKDADYIKEYIKGAKAVMNLAGAPLMGKRWTKEYKEILIKSRVETTELLVKAINEMEEKPEAFLSSSASGYFGDRGDEILKEESSPGTNSFLSEICIKWEGAAKNLDKNVRKVIIRTGVVLSPDDGALETMSKAYKWYAGGPLGEGNQYFPWIHIADWKRFVRFAVRFGNVSGKFNLSAPNPVRINVLSKEISEVLNRPNIFRVPEFVLKILLGEASETVLNSQRMIPSRIKGETDFEYKYEDVSEAIESFRKNF